MHLLVAGLMCCPLLLMTDRNPEGDGAWELEQMVSRAPIGQDHLREMPGWRGEPEEDSW